MFSKKATKIDKISPSIWHYVVSVKSTVKISSIFVAFLENTNLPEPPEHVAIVDLMIFKSNDIERTLAKKCINFPYSVYLFSSGGSSSVH